jgi:predicted dehydrogenase
MSRKDNPFRFGIVGCGGISHAHGHAARTTDVATITACCDIREDTAKEWAAEYGCTGVYTDYREMIRNEDMDGVLLATWPNQHREQCLTGREAVEIYSIIKEAGATLMEAFMYRHHPAIAAVEKLVADGKCGAIDSVRADFSSFDPETVSGDDPNRNWRQKKECGGGIPYDFACYCVNACNHFMPSAPKRVQATGSVSREYDTINRVYALVEYEGGQTALIESSKKASDSQELQVIGKGGRISLPIAWTIPDDIVVTTTTPTGWVTFVSEEVNVTKDDPYRLQMENFVAMVTKGAAPGVPLEDSIVNTFTLEAIVTSILEKRPVDIDLPDLG